MALKTSNRVNGHVKEIHMTCKERGQVQIIILNSGCQGKHVIEYDPQARAEYQPLDVKSGDEILFVPELTIGTMTSARMTIWRDGKFFLEKFLGTEDLKVGIFKK